ncbi:MAG: cytochrome-c peroxidase [Crocinitomicaceae bacterium]|nr:cytochrome-c peroxidase [Crocinitomicaceae bacterium]|tara:strand:- start:8654 stop:9703 length:1050 start_codon:yes stop_codon:yes gene_type:complete
MKRIVIIILVSAFALFGSCSKDNDTTPTTVTDLDSPTHNTTVVEIKSPYGFPPMDIHPDNPLTKEAIALGRKLYYEPLLSEGGPQQGMACASCHSQELAFSVSTPGTSVLPHMNLGWNTSYLWNGKIEGKMEDIMTFEVNDFFQSDLKAITASTEYRAAYFQAYGDSIPTKKTTAYALAQFFRTLISADSNFDRFMRGESDLTSLEKIGYKIFNTETGDCFHCHGFPLMTDNDFHNIGLDATFSATNFGRYEITGRDSDKGKFKTPSLRNIELTAPYMHDGRFNTLEEVVEHYNSGIKKSAYLDPLMSKNNPDNKLNLTLYQKEALVAYLKALTDNGFTTNPDLSNPNK